MLKIKLFFSMFILSYFSPLSAAIYDCFIFFNELEILEVRLNELYSHVDKFVIVESTKTFTGNPKPLYFKENRGRFKKFEDKIIHIVTSESFPGDPWRADFYQRDQISRGLRKCKPDDVILISDADEIVRASFIPHIMNELFSKGAPAVRLGLDYFRYFINVKQKRCIAERNTVATTYKYLSRTSPNQLRWAQRRNDLGFAYIPDAGWHFTSMGGIGRVAFKFESFAHQELNHSKNKTIEFVMSELRANGEIVPIDDTFPWWMVANRKYFEEAGFIYLKESL